MQEPQTQVLMSTYNGDRYLQEQLDSIYAQRGVSTSALAHRREQIYLTNKSNKNEL